MMTSEKLLSRMEVVRSMMVSDGKIDWNESSLLFAYVSRAAESGDAKFCEFLALLERCRADGKIQPEESDEIQSFLDMLIRRLRRRVYAIRVLEAVGLAVLVATFVYFCAR